MATDLVIEIDNEPGALARVAAAVSDAGVNLAAATCLGPGDRAELHILVPHAEAVRHALAITNVAVTREREVVVVDVEDRPGELADIARRVAKEGINLDLDLRRHAQPCGARLARHRQAQARARQEALSRRRPRRTGRAGAPTATDS